MDRLDSMRTFVAVAEHESFAEAARQLRLSAAATTRGVAQLEEALGVTLLSRTTRSVRLTERGALYLDRCRQILHDVDDAQRLVLGDDAEPRGALSVTAPVVFGRMHVLPILQQLLHDHRSLSVRLTLADRVARLVDDGFDVAVRIGELADSALTAVKVGEVQRVLVASPSYLAAHGTPAAPAALGGHSLVAFEGIAATNEWRFGKDGEIGIRIDPRLSVNGADAAVAAAESGCGITSALSYQVSEAVRAGRLCLVLHDLAPAPMPVSLVYQATRLGAANLTAFVRAARAHFAAHPVGLARAGGA
jgi:DNA-binding transcriptional LysR family regulator